MNAMYDVVCSVVIGGIVFLMLVGFNGNIAESAAAQTIKVIAQTNLTAARGILENEFNKMGYQIGSQDSAIVYADSNEIAFIGDFRNVGNIDTLDYLLNTTAPSGQANTTTRILYRTSTQMGSAPTTESINLGITQFRISYFDMAGNPITVYPIAQTSLVKSVKVAINLESTVPYKETTMPYLKLNPGVYWERSFKPRNLK